jgi:hypothetical protein
MDAPAVHAVRSGVGAHRISTSIGIKSVVPRSGCSTVPLKRHAMNNHGNMQSSSVYFIERSSVPETTIPHFVNHFHSLDVVSAARPAFDGQDGTSPDTILMVLRKGELPVFEELVRPATFAAEIGGTDL